MPIVQTGRSRGFISTESPEPGYLVVCLRLDPFRSAGRLRVVPPPLSILWHLPFTYRRQLVPTVGMQSKPHKVQSTSFYTDKEETLRMTHRVTRRLGGYCRGNYPW